MQAKIKEKWLKALRGRKYKQATGQLKGVANGQSGYYDESKAGHCCLGVLLDVVEPDGWSDRKSFDGRVLGQLHKRSSVARGKPQSGQYISPSFAKKLGIPAGVQKKLAQMNDRGDSFTAIADYIEREIPTDQ